MLSDVAQIPEVKISDDFTLRFETDGLTDFGKQIAEKELRETPEIKQKAIEDLKKLLEGKSCVIIMCRRCYKYLPKVSYEGSIDVLMNSFIHSIETVQSAMRLVDLGKGYISV